MSAEALKAEGNTALKAGNFDEAIAKYTEAIALDASNKVFFSNRSAAYLSKGDAEKALEDAEQCLALDSAWAKGHVRKGAALHGLKRYDDAFKAYSEGLKKVPGDAALTRGLEEVRRVRAEAEAAASRANNPLAKLFGPELLSRMAMHPKYRGWLTDETFMAKFRMLSANPTAAMQTGLQDPQLMEIIQFALGMPAGGPEDFPGGEPAAPAPEAQASASKESEPTPAPEPEPEPEVELTEEEKADRDRVARAQEAKARGNALYKAKNFEEALAAYDEAIAIDDREMLYINNKATVYFEMGDYDKALELCDQAVEVGRANRAPFQSLAKPFVRKARIAKARNDYEEAMKQYHLAQREHRDKKIEREMKMLELEKRERERKAYVNPELAQEAKSRGNEKFRAGDFGGAIAEYEEAVKRDPSDAPIRNNLAAALQKVGDFNGALNSVKKALELDEKYVKAWAKKGDIEFYMKEYHKAMESYQKGLAVDDSNQLCRDGLQKVVAAINTSSGPDEERLAHAMADPEIQSLLRDPVVVQVIRDFKENPSAAQQAMQNPGMQAKINKLMAAGVLG